MIGQHPQLYGLPELKLFAYRTIGELDASLPREARERGFAHRSPGLVRAVAELEFGGQDENTLQAALAWLRDRPRWTGAHLLDHLIGRVHSRIPIEKSPEHVNSTGALERMARAYPRARYIHLTRHPITTITSMNRHLQRTLPGAQEIDFTPHCIKTWLNCNNRIDTVTCRLPPERWRHVRAEDVLNTPTPIFHEIATWLGIRSDTAAIEAMLHPEQSPFAGFAPKTSGVSGGNDPTFLADPRPRPIEQPPTFAHPLEWRADLRLWASTRRAAEQLGYT